MSKELTKLDRTVWIRTISGKKFYPLDPKPEMIDIKDIAHALSHICRYTGHTLGFYSVAQHSVLVARLIRESGFDIKVALQGLLHDASEAYISDISTPVKSQLHLYQEIERNLMITIYKTFGLPTVDLDPVKMADRVVYTTEVRDVLRKVNNPESWSGLAPMVLRDVITPWTPKDARSKFLLMFENLDGQRIPF